MGRKRENGCRDGGENDRIGGALSLRDDERFVVFNFLWLLFIFERVLTNVFPSLFHFAECDVAESELSR